jgi:serine/threonine protein kinase
MGEVYAATDLRLERDVAIKVIRAGRIDPDSRARFEREARAVARVRHDNVIAIFDSGELEDGSAFLITELLEGADLGEIIRLHGRGRISQVAEFVRQGVAALAAVHAAGIVHRDVKPSNLFLIDAKGEFQVKLVDFGIAKGLDFDSKLTHSGAIIGTPAYMAPEQITMGMCDQRSDLFSFAAVVYETLTGVRLSGSAGQLSALWNAMTAPVTPPSAHRRSLTDVVDRLLVATLAKNPADRPDPQSWAIKLVEALNGIHDRELGWPAPFGASTSRNLSTSDFRSVEEARSTIASPPPT